MIVLNNVLNFFRFSWYVTGPWMYFDLTFCFFLIRIQVLAGNAVTDPSSLSAGLTARTKRPRQMSPFLLNLNLNPLYSRRGGSTIRAEPFTKKPVVVERRLKPL